MHRLLSYFLIAIYSGSYEFSQSTLAYGEIHHPQHWLHAVFGLFCLWGYSNAYPFELGRIVPVILYWTSPKYQMLKLVHPRPCYRIGVGISS